MVFIAWRPKHHNFSPPTLRGTTVRRVLVVTAPHNVALRALQAGAESVLSADERNGWLLGRIIDPCGHRWEIGRSLDHIG